MATTITVKGQVTIPKRVRDALGLNLATTWISSLVTAVKWCCGGQGRKRPGETRPGPIREGSRMR